MAYTCTVTHNQCCVKWGPRPYLYVVFGCVDYCNIMFAAASKSVTDKMQRVLKDLNAAARVFNAAHRSTIVGCISDLLHTELHWIDVQFTVLFIVVCSARHLSI